MNHHENHHKKKKILRIIMKTIIEIHDFKNHHEPSLTNLLFGVATHDELETSHDSPMVDPFKLRRRRRTHWAEELAAAPGC